MKMGYRSSGAIWFSQKGYDNLTDEMRDFLAEEEKNEQFDTVCREDGILFQFSKWKWYDSYAEIKMYESMFAHLDNDEFDFVRIGEGAEYEISTHVKFGVFCEYQIFE